MENKELKKSIPVELDDAALDNVSGGAGSIVAVILSQENAGEHDSSYAGGIAGNANSGEIKNH